ncbi:MAG: hypothetical protein SynsKO_18360 [Synoicihabitans sp.]
MAICATAQSMVPLDLNYARINLSNGRVLKQATLTGINRESDLIYVLEDRKLKPYPRKLFPTFVTDRVDDRLAEFPADKPNSRAIKASPKTPTAKSDASRAPIGSPERNAADRAAIEAAVAAKAETAARRHFRYGQRSGSGYTATTSSEVDLDSPVAIPGWPGRYRVKGVAYYSYYDSVGTTFHNRRRGVEVIVEAQSPSRVKVLEVNTDWTPSR